MNGIKGGFYRVLQRPDSRLLALRLKCADLGFAEIPCKTILNITVSTTQARTSSRPGIENRSNTSRAKRIGARSRGPNQPRNIFF